MEVPNRATIEVCITEAGGFGDISAGINIVESLSRDYNILITFESTLARKKYTQIANNRLNFKTEDAYNPNEAIARVVPFRDSVILNLPKKPSIVISQYNGEPYLYGYADYTILSGLGIEENGRYNSRLKPEQVIRSGLYIKEINFEDKICRTDICSELSRILSNKTPESEEITEIYKELAERTLEDSEWITSYKGVLGVDGIVYDALAEAVSKSESFAQKKPVVLEFTEQKEFEKYVIPACERNGFNVIYADDQKLKVINRKSPVTVINFGYVDDELYEQAVKKADLMNISAGDGSFTKGFSAFTKTRTPFLKYYNRDQREFMKGLVDILREIEKEEGLSSVSSDFFETFTAFEHVYKTAVGYKDSTAIECRKYLHIDNISRLFYDEMARQEFYKAASKIPEKIKQRREAEGIEAAEILPNALDTAKYIIEQIIQGKAKEKIFESLTGRCLIEEPVTKKETNKSGLLGICEDISRFFQNIKDDVKDLLDVKKISNNIKDCYQAIEYLSKI